MSLENPSWHSFADRQLYSDLFYHNPGRPLTQEEEDFCTMMYHFEEYANGLGGDL